MIRLMKCVLVIVSIVALVGYFFPVYPEKLVTYEASERHSREDSVATVTHVNRLPFFYSIAWKNPKNCSEGVDYVSVWTGNVTFERGSIC